MARLTGGNTNTALARDAIVTYLLLDLNGTYYTDAPYDIVYDSKTFSAQGIFLSITSASETSELSITSITITLSALDSTAVSTFAVSSIINKDVVIHRALVDQTDNSIIDDSTGDGPILIFQGRVAGYQINDAEKTAGLAIQVDSLFSNFEKVSCRRTNLKNFQREFPADFSMEYSHEAIKDIRWGKK